MSSARDASSKKIPPTTQVGYFTTHPTHLILNLLAILSFDTDTDDFKTFLVAAFTTALSPYLFSKIEPSNFMLHVSDEGILLTLPYPSLVPCNHSRSVRCLTYMRWLRFTSELCVEPTNPPADKGFSNHFSPQFPPPPRGPTLPHHFVTAFNLTYFCFFLCRYSLVICLFHPLFVSSLHRMDWVLD